MARKYYTLCTREDGKWSPQFGDYDRAVVTQEADDSYWNQGRKEEGKYRRQDMKIIKLANDRQATLVDALEKLNAV